LGCPIALRGSVLPRLKIDLIADEMLVDSIAPGTILHLSKPFHRGKPRKVGADGFLRHRSCGFFACLAWRRNCAGLRGQRREAEGVIGCDRVTECLGMDHHQASFVQYTRYALISGQARSDSGRKASSAGVEPISR
jgi:hypothetical protein